jgi:hypothetical protein
VKHLIAYPHSSLQVYAQHQSMYNIRAMNASEYPAFHDITVLGTFADNHDNPRSLAD